ncbi:MAG: hypothetical protein ACPG06_00345 [Alphaproteobacteria bacterium]
MKPSTLILAAIILGFSAGLAAAQSPRVEQERYETCLSLIDQNPDQAFDMAIEWRDNGGRMPARHCAALALIGLELYPQAAERLELLAVAPGRAGTLLRAEILGQAGMAHALHGDSAAARIAFERALDMLRQADLDGPENLAPLLVDLASVHLMFGDAQSTLDITREIVDALDTHPPHIMAEALALRASALRGVEDKGGADREAQAALAYQPNHPRALYERGLYAQSQGDGETARTFLLQAIAVDDKSELAELARIALQNMALNRAPASQAPATQP